MQIGGGGTRARRGSDAAAPCTVPPPKSKEELEREVISLQDSLQASLQAEQDAREAEKWARGMIESLQFQLDHLRSQSPPREQDERGEAEGGNVTEVYAPKDASAKGRRDSVQGESGGRAGEAMMIGPRKCGDNVGMIEMKKEELASMHAQIATAASVVNSLKTSLESERSKVETLQKVREHASKNEGIEREE